VAPFHQIYLDSRFLLEYQDCPGYQSILAVHLCQEDRESPNLLVDLVRPEDQEDLEDPAILSLLELLVVQLGQLFRLSRGFLEDRQLRTMEQLAQLVEVVLHKFLFLDELDHNS